MTVTEIGTGASRDAADLLVLTVTDRSEVARDVVALGLCAGDGAPLPTWHPGAHIEVRLPTGGGELVRHYSLCGDPDDSGRWQIAVLREPAGRGGSAYMHDRLHVGTTVTVSRPRNNFTVQSADRYLFVAGGIGVTPILPMVRDVAARGCDWQLVVCARSADRIALASQIGALPQDRVRVHLDSRDGVVDTARLIADRGPETGVYVCGPAGLITAFEELADTGRWRLHFEKFVAEQIDTADDSAFEVEIASTGQIVQIPDDATVLHTLNDMGMEIPSSCEEGTCGTCETGVLSGIPDHRDGVLSKKEKALNDCMMLCVSRARCPRLVLDL